MNNWWHAERTKYVPVDGSRVMPCTWHLFTERFCSLIVWETNWFLVVVACLLNGHHHRWWSCAFVLFSLHPLPPSTCLSVSLSITYRPHPADKDSTYGEWNGEVALELTVELSPGGDTLKGHYVTTTRETQLNYNISWTLVFVYSWRSIGHINKWFTGTTNGEHFAQLV